VNKQRPVNLDLFTIKFPITAIVSILHRASGVFLFLLIPFLLWMLGSSLSSPEGFAAIADLLNSFLVKLFILLIMGALYYHLVAGIRHLIMDTGRGEELQKAQFTARLTIVIAIILTLVTGIWLW